MKTKKRVLAALLALVLCLSFVPMTVAADGYEANDIIAVADSMFNTLQVTNITKAGNGNLTVEITATGDNNFSYHIGEYDLIAGEDLVGENHATGAIEGEYGMGTGATIGTPITFVIPAADYNTDGIKIGMAMATAGVPTVAMYEFRLDKNGDWYAPKVTMPEGGDKYVGAAFTATIAMNAGAYDSDAEITAVPAGTVTVSLDGTDITTDCTIAYVENGGITVEVPSTVMVVANKDKKISIQVSATGLKDKDDTAFTVSGTNPAEFTIKEGQPIEVTWDDSTKFTDENKDAVSAAYGDAEFTITASPDNNGKDVTYSSSDTNVATVGEDGKVTILKSGTAVITATSQPKDGTTGVIAGTATYTLTVGKGTPAITFANTTQTAGSVTAVTASAKVGTVDVTPGAVKYQVPNQTFTVGSCNCEATSAETDSDNHTAECAAFAAAANEYKEWADEIIVDAKKTTVGDYINGLPAESTVNVQATVEAVTDKYDAKTETGTLTLTAAEENSIPLSIPTAKEEHSPYMVGRAAGMFVPNGNMTRAEAAAVLSRLTEGFDENGVYPAAPYSDVDADAWYAKYVNFAAANGIVTGYEDGTFKPNKPITRAELATMIAGFAKIAKVDTAAVSSDVAGHWAEGYIAALEMAGIVNGYADGTFRPDQNIIRAEAATMVNGAIGRTPVDPLDMTVGEYENPFLDVSASQWFFANVMEATVLHEASHFHK